MVAVGELARTDPLDEAITFVFVRLPAVVVIERATHLFGEHLVDLALHGQALAALICY
jgi:hypothetical protein